MVTVLAALTLIADILIVLALIAWIVERFAPLPFLAPIKRFIRENALAILFAIPLIATAGSLYFSEIRGWAPCKLCWYQRIFMYPQVVIVATALIRKARGITAYLVPLSAIGALIAAFHYTEQIRAVLRPLDPFAPCDTTGISCATSYTFHFGYITIPMMALSAFLLMLAVIAIARKK